MWNALVYGGDAGVSILVHNRLREISASGIETVCIVDGVAMSGGSLIMCACDTVRANPSSLIMIHKAWSFLFGGYNADEMRSKAKENDAWDKAQVEIYKRKCGLSDTVLMHMMSETTTMTGREAVEKGFADEVIEDAEPLNIAASADRKALFINGRAIRVPGECKIPQSISSMSSDHSSIEGRLAAASFSPNKYKSYSNHEKRRADAKALVKALLGKK